jgi:hypothetical protein
MEIQFITTGVTRWVLLIGKWAIKFPNPCAWKHFLLGLVGNMEESLTWKCANVKGSALYEVRTSLCPVLWCSWGGWILIMRRAQPVDYIVFLHNWISENPIRNHFSDLKRENIGFLDNKIVLIDYASKK